MSPGDLIRFAWMAVVRHRLRTGLSLLGVAIGVAAVVVLTSLGEGARRYVTGEFASLGSNLVMLMPGRTETTGNFPGLGAGVPHDLTLADARALERGVPGVRGLAPVAMGNETVAHRERRRQVRVIGSTAAFLEARSLSLARGSFLPPVEMERGGQVAVLGATVARELFPDGSALGRVVRVGEWRMRVIGVLAKHGTQLGVGIDDAVIVPVATGMRMFNRSSLFQVIVRTHSHEDMDGVCQRIVAIVSERHEEEDVTCVTQESVVSSLGGILTVLTLAIGGIAAVSLTVAGIGIMNVMLVSVSERTREVGLLKAVGAQRRQILAVFLTEAVLLAAAGALAGLAIGLIAVRAIVWWNPAFPAATPMWAAAAALATALVTGVVFGVLPARRATRLDPVTALAGR